MAALCGLGKKQGKEEAAMRRIHRRVSSNRPKRENTSAAREKATDKKIPRESLSHALRSVGGLVGWRHDTRVEVIKSEDHCHIFETVTGTSKLNWIT